MPMLKNGTIGVLTDSVRDSNSRITSYISTSELAFTNKQRERAGIELGLNRDDWSIRMAICDTFTGNVGCNTSMSIDLTPNKVLELIDKLYGMLGTLESGVVVNGEFYPFEEDFKNEE